MNAAANVFFLIFMVFSLYFLAVSLLGLGWQQSLRRAGVRSPEQAALTPARK